MKVLIACSTYYPHVKGGGELSTQLLAEGLARKGVEVAVVSTAKEDSIEVINNVRVYRIKYPNIYWSYEKSGQNFLKKIIWFLLNSYNFLSKKKFSEVLNKEKPDLVHTSTLEDISPYVWKVSKKLGYKVVHTLRSYTLLCPKGDMFKNGKNCKGQCLSCKIVSFPMKVLTKYVDNVVGNSSFILQKHLSFSYFKKSKTAVIYNIFDNNEDLPEPESFKFGFIGRIHETKGVEILLDALNNAGLPKSLSLVVAGKGDKKYIDFLNKKFPNVNIAYLGFVDSIEFYKSVNVVVVPSIWHEPLGRVIYESFSYGRPVIGSDTGGTSEILKNNKTGFLFNHEDTKDLISKMVLVYHIYKNDKEKYKEIKNNCLNAAKAFSSDIILEKYISCYKQ